MPTEIWGLSVSNRTGHFIRVEDMDIIPDDPQIRLIVPVYEQFGDHKAPLVVQRAPEKKEIERVCNLIIKTGCDLVIVNMMTLKWLDPRAARYAAAISSRPPHALRGTNFHLVANKHLVVRREFSLVPEEYRGGETPTG